MAREIQFDLFANQVPAGRDLVFAWHQKARSAAKRQHHDSFDAFMRLWIGFNQWAMRVTEADFDADMIRKLAESPALNRAFAKLLAGDREMQTYVKVFAAFWPIFNVKDLRKKGLRHQHLELPRPGYVTKMREADVQHAPRGNLDRNKPSWDHTIRAIYQVRCNLIHGEKGDSSEDYNIVEGAYRVLLSFVERTELYRWPDVEAAQRHLNTQES
jgi:hypothetical protein